MDLNVGEPSGMLINVYYINLFVVIPFWKRNKHIETSIFLSIKLKKKELS